jgi:hypothetical protein
MSPDLLDAAILHFGGAPHGHGHDHDHGHGHGNGHAYERTIELLLSVSSPLPPLIAWSPFCSF